MNTKYIKIFGIIICLALMASLVMSSDKAGEIRALKGKASIIRSDKAANAAVKATLLLMDIVETEKDSKAKILFVDDSLLTLGEKSRLLVKEYLLGDDKKRGQSVFNLIDGKVRAIVGKNKLEIHTPTSVAAARGTVLITWINKEGSASSCQAALKGVKEGASCLAVIKGVVDSSNKDASVRGSEEVSGGYMNCVDKGMPPSRPVPIPPDCLKQLLEETTVNETPGLEVPQGAPGQGGFEGGFAVPPIDLPPNLPHISPDQIDPCAQCGGCCY
jgi:hypothetical protein